MLLHQKATVKLSHVRTKKFSGGRGTDQPQDIRLDLTGARSLALHVELGERYDIGDHVVLANAWILAGRARKIWSQGAVVYAVKNEVRFVKHIAIASVFVVISLTILLVIFRAFKYRSFQSSGYDIGKDSLAFWARLFGLFGAFGFCVYLIIITLIN